MGDFMGFFFEGYTLTTIAVAIVVVLILVILNEVTRKSKWTAIAVYCGLPVILYVLISMGLLGSPSANSWFGWVKTISALIGVIGFMLIRYTKVGNMKHIMIFPMAILFINIVEAIYREYEVFTTYATPATDAAGLFLQGGVWNIMNGFAGLFLLLTLSGWMGIRISKTKSRDMVWPDQTWLWIIAYDLWNIAYCYNSISTRALYAGVLIIIACTLCEFFCKRGVWLQHRAQTLALFAMFSLAVDYQGSYGTAFGIVSTNSTTALFVVSFVSLIANAALFIYAISIMVKRKRNPFKQELYTHLKDYNHNLTANGLEVINTK